MIRPMENLDAALPDCRLPLSDVWPTLLRHGQALTHAGADAVSACPGVIRTDSRLINQGDLFLAYRGVTSDGHAHLASAVERGAALLIGEDAAALANAGKGRP